MTEVKGPPINPELDKSVDRVALLRESINDTKKGKLVFDVPGMMERPEVKNIYDQFNEVFNKDEVNDKNNNLAEIKDGEEKNKFFVDMFLKVVLDEKLDKYIDVIIDGDTKKLEEMMTPKFALVAEAVMDRVMDNEDLKLIRKKMVSEGKDKVKGDFDLLIKNKGLENNSQAKLLEYALGREGKSEAKQTEETGKKEETEEGILGKIKDEELKTQVKNIWKEFKELGEVYSDHLLEDGELTPLLGDIKKRLLNLRMKVSKDDGDKKVLSDLMKYVNGFLSSFKENKESYKNKTENMEIISCWELFDYFKVHLDSFDQVNSRMAEVSQKDIANHMMECALAIRRFGLLERKIECVKESKGRDYFDNLKISNESLIQLKKEKSKLEELFKTFVADYKKQRNEEWSRMSDDDKSDINKDVFINTIFTKDFVIDLNGNLITGEEREEDEEDFKEWALKKGFPLEGLNNLAFLDDKKREEMYNRYDYNSLRKRFRLQRSYEKGDEFLRDYSSKKWWEDFAAFYKDFKDKSIYTDNLFTYLMPYFPLHKPPKEIQDVCKDYADMDDGVWGDIMVPLNDWHNSARGWDGAGNSSDYVEFMKRASKTIYGGDMINLREMPGYWRFLKKIVKSLTQKEEGASFYRAIWTKDGEIAFNEKKLSQVFKELQESFEEEIRQGGPDDNLYGLLTHKDGYKLLDLACLGAANTVYASGLLADSRQRKDIYKKDKEGKYVKNPLNGEDKILYRIEAGPMKGSGQYCHCQLNGGKEIKKILPWEIYVGGGISDNRETIKVGRDGQATSYASKIGAWCDAMFLSADIRKKAEAVAAYNKIINMDEFILPEGGCGFNYFEWTPVTKKTDPDPGKWEQISLLEAIYEDVDDFDIPYEIKKLDEKDLASKEYFRLIKEEDDKKYYISEGLSFVEWTEKDGKKSYYQFFNKDTATLKRLTTAEWIYAYKFVYLLYGMFDKNKPLDLQGILKDFTDIKFPRGETPFKDFNSDPFVISRILAQVKGLSNKYSKWTLSGFDGFSSEYTEYLMSLFSSEKEFGRLIAIEDNDKENKNEFMFILLELLGGGKTFWGREKYSALRLSEDNYREKIQYNRSVERSSYAEAVKYYKEYIKPEEDKLMKKIKDRRDWQRKYRQKQ